jgi:hypothetical protein
VRRKDGIVKSILAVTPVKAGVQNPLKQLDLRLRWDGRKNISATFFEVI